MSEHRSLSDLLSFTDWANAAVLGVLPNLSEEQWRREVGGSFGTVAATAAHAVASEWVWLERWQGRSPSGGPAWAAAPNAADLVMRSREIARERREWFDGLDEGVWEREVTYSRFNGDVQANSLDVLIRHVANHATYHRGQIVAFLRNLGERPPSTDLVLWDRLHRARP